MNGAARGFSALQRSVVDGPVGLFYGQVVQSITSLVQGLIDQYTYSKIVHTVSSFNRGASGRSLEVHESAQKSLKSPLDSARLRGSPHTAAYLTNYIKNLTEPIHESVRNLIQSPLL